MRNSISLLLHCKLIIYDQCRRVVKRFCARRMGRSTYEHLSPPITGEVDPIEAIGDEEKRLLMKIMQSFKYENAISSERRGLRRKGASASLTSAGGRSIRVKSTAAKLRRGRLALEGQRTVLDQYFLHYQAISEQDPRLTHIWILLVIKVLNSLSKDNPQSIQIPLCENPLIHDRYVKRIGLSQNRPFKNQNRLGPLLNWSVIALIEFMDVTS